MATNALGGATHQELTYGTPALGTDDNKISLPFFGFVNNLLIRCTDSHASGAWHLRADYFISQVMQLFQGGPLNRLEFERSIA
jgi:hypothetical protein